MSAGAYATAKRRQIAAAALIWVALLAGCAGDRASPSASISPAYVGLSVEPWHFGPNRGQRIRTRNYDVYTTIADAQYNRRLAVTLESAYGQYERLTGLPPAPTQPDESRRLLRCYVFANRAQLVAFTKIAYPAREDLLGINRGGYTVDDVFASAWAGDFTIATAAHEGFHQYLSRRMRESIPPFLEEGLASMFENLTWSMKGDPRWDFARSITHSQKLARAVQADVLIPLAILVRVDAGTVLADQRTIPYELYYAQCWAFARFMIEGEGGRHRPALARMFADAGEGRLYDPTGKNPRPLGTFRPSESAAAIERALGMPIDQIEPGYQDFVRQLARSARFVD